MSKWYPRLFTFASPSLISIYKTAERIINSSLVTTCILNTYLSLLTFQALLHSRQCREHWSSEMLLMFGRKLCIPFSLTLASLLLSSAKIIIYYRSQNHINHQHTPWSSPPRALKGWDCPQSKYISISYTLYSHSLWLYYIRKWNSSFIWS